MKEVVIIKAGGNNFASIEDSLERLGCKFFYAQKESDITSADRIIIPGVGSMMNANIEEFRNIVPSLKQPTLGICLGMQMLFESSQENENFQGFGVMQGNILRFKNDVIAPHTGWNELVFEDKTDIFAKENGNYVYFTHTYYAPFGNNTTSYCTYGDYKVSGIVQKNNFYGFQFHPERSGECGERLLNTFITKT